MIFLAVLDLIQFLIKKCYNQQSTGSDFFKGLGISIENLSLSKIKPHPNFVVTNVFGFRGFRGFRVFDLPVFGVGLGIHARKNFKMYFHYC